jgi:tape measure domain-containing protein
MASRRSGGMGFMGFGLVSHSRSAPDLESPLRSRSDYPDTGGLYGNARVQGRLFAKDINQLTGRGIPIIQRLARQFGVSDSQVEKLVETDQVGFPQTRSDKRPGLVALLAGIPAG